MLTMHVPQFRMIPPEFLRPADPQHADQALRKRDRDDAPTPLFGGTAAHACPASGLFHHVVPTTAQRRINFDGVPLQAGEMRARQDVARIDRNGHLSNIINRYKRGLKNEIDVLKLATYLVNAGDNAANIIEQVSAAGITPDHPLLFAAARMHRRSEVQPVRPIVQPMEQAEIVISCAAGISSEPDKVGLDTPQPPHTDLRERL